MSVRLVTPLPPNVICYRPHCSHQRFVPVGRGVSKGKVCRADTPCKCGEVYVIVL